jgi:ATP-dependent DNA helicase RecG
MPETQNIEYKQNWHDDYLKWICGFANTQGGQIYIGKDDDGKTVGIENYKLLMDELPNKIKNNIWNYRRNQSFAGRQQTFY